jgi:hypothetical protein
MNAALPEIRATLCTAQQALLWIPLGQMCVPVEVTVHTDVVAFEAPDWVPDSVFDYAHRVLFPKETDVEHITSPT